MKVGWVEEGGRRVEVLKGWVQYCTAQGRE